MQKTLSFLYFWFLSRTFAPHELGSYLWVLSLSGLFVLGIDFGLTAVLTREAAKSESDAVALGRATLGLKLPLSALTAGALFMLVFFLRPDPAILMMTAAAALIMILDAFTMVYFALLRARQVLTYESFVLIFFQSLVLLTGWVLALITHSLPVVIWALAAGSAANLIIMSWGVWRVYGLLLIPSFARREIKKLLHLAPAFAGSAIFTKIYALADTILLGVLAGDRAVGLYSIPAKVATALQSLLPGAFSSSIYPSMSNYAKTAPEKLKLLFERSMVYLLALALPIAAGLIIIAPRVIASVWPAYDAAVPAFRIFMVGLPFIFLSFPTGSLLNATGRERINTRNRGIVTAANVALNILLIPRTGIFGAALAYALSNVLFLILDYRSARCIVALDEKYLARSAVKLVAATTLMCATIYALSTYVPLLALIAAGGLAYACSTLILQVFSRAEWAFMRALLSRRAVSAPDISSI